MSLTLDDLFTSPDHYLHSFDQADAIFVPMNREAYRCSIFLDDRIIAASEGSMRVPVQTLAGVRADPLSGSSWIFHVAHCGSTLLSRALDELCGKENLVLREPLSLRQAALARDETKLALALRMLGKRYPGGGPSLVKGNVPVNFIIPEIVATQPDDAAIFLYYDLDDYLLAILRSENHRAWLRRVVHELAYELGETEHLADGECAAALWLAQIRLFNAGLARMPLSRSLDAEAFFGDPGASLLAAAKLLGFECSPTQIDTVINGDVFKFSAKNPRVAFDNDARVRRAVETSNKLEVDMELAKAWIKTSAPDIDLVIADLEKRALV